MQLRVDPLPLAERVIQAHAAEDGAQRRARQLIDGDEVVADAEQGKFRIDDLAEDGRVDADRDVVAGDDVLLVAGPGRFPDVDQPHRVDQRHQECQTGLPDRMELADALDDADVALLNDVDGAGDNDDGQENDDGADDQGRGHDSTSSLMRLDLTEVTGGERSIRCCAGPSRPPGSPPAPNCHPR